MNDLTVVSMLVYLVMIPVSMGGLFIIGGGFDGSPEMVVIGGFVWPLTLLVVVGLLVGMIAKRVVDKLLPMAAMLAAVCLASTAFAGHPCYVRQQVVAHHQQYVAPVSLSFFVGAPIRIAAEVEKSLQENPEYNEFQQFRAWKRKIDTGSTDWKSTATGQPVAPSAPDGSPALLIAAKCAKCHSGDNAKGGFVADGTQAISDDGFRRFSEMYLTGENVPDAMKPLLQKLKPEEGSAILAELVKLKQVSATAADAEPGELK